MRSEAWQKFENKTAKVLGAKLTRASGRLDDKGDAKNEVLVNEAKMHQFERNGKLYTIIRGEWFRTLVKHSIRSNHIPVLSAGLGDFSVYFVPRDLIDDDLGPYPQGKTQVSLKIADILDIYGHTLEFAGYTWVALREEEVKEVFEDF